MKSTILISAWLLLAAMTNAATILHHYTFDGVTVVDSVGTSNGTLLNGASNSSGRLNLDGNDDYVQFGEHIIPTTGSFSVAFFAQELSRAPFVAEIISQGSSGQPGFYIGYDQSHNIRIGDSLPNTGVPFPSDGLLHHYAVTAGADTRLYIDGSLRGTFGSISTASGGTDTRIGNQFAGTGPEFFHGNVDDLRIYNGTLTASEVVSLTVPEPCSIALFAFGAVAMSFRRTTRRSETVA